ncbi:unnamed protein product [Brassicogethes aeneus]|uniref:Uncharacterized protein n=1 Tax=Brassicogethes aeneus TaxID=1431903 RepID=A0A9P0BJD0_BRAAE|nr:unnamed protein product [Brassicogethes aeneus]
MVPQQKTIQETLNLNKEQHVLDLKVKDLEIGLTSFLTEHNIPFLAIDHLTRLLKSKVTDSKIIQGLHLSRTKATNIVNNVLAPDILEEHVKYLQTHKFSLLIDESTDIGNVKSSVCTRYFNDVTNKVEVQSLGLVDIFSKNFNEANEGATETEFPAATDAEVSEPIPITSHSSDNTSPFHPAQQYQTKINKAQNHQTELEILSIPKRPGQLKLFGVRNKGDLSEKEKSELHNCIVQMIVTDFQPLTLVENIGFLAYTKKLNPLYTPPSRKTFTNKIIPDLYNRERANVKKILDEVNHVAIKTDMWSSDSNKSYITVTCHIIYQNRFISRVLATEEITVSHTGKNIANAISNIFETWGISDKVVTIVFDSGANIKNAINEHLHKYHHPCIAHTLNLSVNESLNNNEILNVILKKSRNLVTHFKHSILASQKLRDIQQKMNLQVLKVKQDVSTRWNSTLIIIERLDNLKTPLTVALSELPRAPECLDASEWEVIFDCIPLLTPIANMTTELSGEKYLTISIVIPLIRGLQSSLRIYCPKTEVGEKLKKSLVEVIARRLGSIETNEILAKATLLDPRLKKTSFWFRRKRR